jgi:hypothetical protein
MAPGQDTAVRERALHISARAIESISDAVHELDDLGLVKPATVQTRVYTTSPAFKLYVLNGEETFPAVTSKWAKVLDRRRHAR